MINTQATASVLNTVAPLTSTYSPIHCLPYPPSTIFIFSRFFYPSYYHLSHTSHIPCPIVQQHQCTVKVAISGTFGANQLPNTVLLECYMRLAVPSNLMHRPHHLIFPFMSCPVFPAALSSLVSSAHIIKTTNCNSN